MTQGSSDPAGRVTPHQWEPEVLKPADLPGLFQSADTASGAAQRSFFRSTALRLSLAVLAAVGGAVTVRIGKAGIDLAAVITVLAFVSVLVTDVFVLHTRVGAGWYEGRALAESTKTLSWRYAVGGAPFPVNLPAEEADTRFLARLHELLHDVPAVGVTPSRAQAISPMMRRLRAADLPDRQRAYLSGRVQDQEAWYVNRATQHARRASRLQTAALLMEVVGVAAALGKAIGIVPVDLAGVVAALIAAIAAWSAAKQYRTTATAYTLASHELGLIQNKLDQSLPEEQWSRLVADAEGAISREHITWRASHRD